MVSVALGRPFAMSDDDIDVEVRVALAPLRPSLTRHHCSNLPTPMMNKSIRMELHRGER